MTGLEEALARAHETLAMEAPSRSELINALYLLTYQVDVGRRAPATEGHRCEDPGCWRADGTHSDECVTNIPYWGARSYQLKWPRTVRGKPARVVIKPRPLRSDEGDRK